MINFNNIEKLDLYQFYVFINKENGIHVIVDKEITLDKNTLEQYLVENKFFYKMEDYNFSKQALYKFELTSHITSNCNLNCKYCFSNKTNDGVSVNDTIKFVNLILDNYPNASEIYLDVTGAGEPLLEFNKIKELNKYCKNERSKDLWMQLTFATNGTLLKKDVINFLQDENIYFGISIDGDKKTNDYFRKANSYKSVYKSIMKNYKNFKKKYLVGCATTITNQTDILRTFKFLSKKFRVISMKPIREVEINNGALTEESIDKILDGYSSFLDFLIDSVRKQKSKYLQTILVSDDYFGRFIKRVLSNKLVVTRCNAAISKFALNSDGKIYCCSAAIGIPTLEVGDIKNGLNHQKIDELFNLQREKKNCQSCWARFYCGGECMVRAYYKNKSLIIPDKTICKLNKHLIKLSFLFKYFALNEYPQIIDDIINERYLLEKDDNV